MACIAAKLSIEWGARMSPSWRAQAPSPFEAVCRFAGIRAEEHGQPGDGTFIVLAPAAHIADPRGEGRHSDQFFAQPGKVGDVPDMHNASGTFTTRRLPGFW